MLADRTKTKAMGASYPSLTNISTKDAVASHIEQARPGASLHQDTEDRSEAPSENLGSSS